MSDENDDRPTASMHDVGGLTIELLEILAEAHKQWTLRRAKLHPGGGLPGAVASHVAFKALLQAFPIEEFVSDPASVQTIEQFALSLDLRSHRRDVGAPAPLTLQA